MKVLLHGKNSKELRALALNSGLEVVNRKPEVVISFGGDGTYLLSEERYPGVPKVMIRDSKVCKKCVNLPTEEVFRRLASGTFITNDIIKLEAVHNRKNYLAVNDVIISHKVPTSAVRYKIFINDRPYIDGREIIGDGIIVSTPFGSGAYYRSITDGVFSVGMGIAFNNSTEQVDHIVVKETDKIRFQLTRGQAVLAVPGQKLGRLVEGDEVSISVSEKRGKILTFGEEFSYWAH